MGRFVKKDIKIARDQKLIEGLRKNVASKESLILGGTKVSRDKMIAIIQEQIDLSMSSKLARIDWIAAANRERDFARKHKALRDVLVDWIRLVFGTSRMHEFGLQPPKKRRKLTSDEKKKMVEKMRATRAARKAANG